MEYTAIRNVAISYCKTSFSLLSLLPCLAVIFFSMASIHALYTPIIQNTPNFGTAHTPTQAHTHSIDCICTAIKLCLTKAVRVRWYLASEIMIGAAVIDRRVDFVCPPSRLLPRRPLSTSAVLKCQKHVLARTEERAGIKRKPNRTREQKRKKKICAFSGAVLMCDSGVTKEIHKRATDLRGRRRAAGRKQSG